MKRLKVMKKTSALSFSDFGLATAGIFSATFSLLFAATMIIKDNEQAINGDVEHPSIFTHYFHFGVNEPLSLKDQSAIDFQTTGIIGTSRQSNHGSSISLNGDITLIDTPERPYEVQVTNDGQPFVTNGGNKIFVKAGMDVPGQGRVLLAEKRAGRWIVVTTKGVLLEAAPHT